MFDALFDRGLIRRNMKGFKVNYIELRLKMFVKFICRVLMISVILLMMVSIVWLIFIKMC